MAEIYKRVLNSKKPLKEINYNKLTDDQMKKLFQKKIEAKPKLAVHRSTDDKYKTPRNINGPLLKSNLKTVGKTHTSNKYSSKSPGTTINKEYLHTDENGRQNTFESNFNNNLHSERTPPHKFRKLIDINTSILNDNSRDNSYISKKTPLNLNFIKIKYNSVGEKADKDSVSFMDNYKNFCKQLKRKMEIDDEESRLEENYYMETDINNPKSTVNQNKFSTILKALFELKERIKHTESIISKASKSPARVSNPPKSQNRKDLTPVRTNKGKETTNQITFQKEKDNYIIENIDKIIKEAEFYEKKLINVKKYYKSKITFLTNTLTDCFYREKKLKEDFQQLNKKHSLLINEFDRMGSKTDMLNKSDIKVQSGLSLPNFNKVL